jgi:DNA-binding NarL/FixJ family response regulator
MTVARVLLADDHALVRAGIRALLENLPDIEVVAEAGDGREALRLMAIYHPDLVLMDVAMPGMNGLEALAEIVKNYPAALVLILSMYSFEEYVLRALHLGARGYLLKDSAPAELEIAVRAVQRGETYLSPPISRCVVMEYLLRVGGASENVSNGLLADLTPHECAVLHLIAEGDSN